MFKKLPELPTIHDSEINTSQPNTGVQGSSISGDLAFPHHHRPLDSPHLDSTLRRSALR